jgi:hypothetical protein
MPVRVLVAGELIAPYRLPTAVMTSEASNQADYYVAFYRLPHFCWKYAKKNQKEKECVFIDPEAWTVHFVQLYCICPTEAQYTLKICFLQHCYMFRRLYIFLRQSLVVYAKFRRLINWQNVYR